ncbi:unnamed protein product [Coregonus sp. 'balchen']|nr:unnamed protein product [Coregonus sp. 'balchen']
MSLLQVLNGTSFLDPQEYFGYVQRSNVFNRGVGQCPTLNLMIRTRGNVTSVNKLAVHCDVVSSLGYNPGQMRAVRTSMSIIRNQQRTPKICLIHGPPGTGKSKTIVGLLQNLFSEYHELAEQSPDCSERDRLSHELKQETGDPALCLGHEPFSCVIVDEAGQTTETETLIPMLYRCKSLILVGESDQLPPTVISQRARELKYSQFLKAPLVTNLHHSCKENKMPSSVGFLSYQYRMHPNICEFPSKHIYHKSLKTDK